MLRHATGVVENIKPPEEYEKEFLTKYGMIVIQELLDRIECLEGRVGGGRSPGECSRTAELLRILKKDKREAKACLLRAKIKAPSVREHYLKRFGPRKRRLTFQGGQHV